VFAKYVRETPVLTLPEAVRRMSGLVADHFGLTGRGYVREGGWADLVVLNPVTVGERATWRLPNAYPEGIDHVLVNGKAAVAGGQPTGALGGQMLTRGA
jgi:N-acyl-D-aspartate/D-glutamate deacylase